MGNCCKGKQEGSDLKFFKLLTQITEELKNRTAQKIKSDMTITTKKVQYKQLYDLLKIINQLTDGELD